MTQSRAQEHIAIGRGREGRETVASHELYYVPASIDEDPLFCGDDRNRHGIQLFGGIISIAYNRAVMEETGYPGSVNDSLKDRVAATTTEAVQAGIRPGVHSDIATEQGPHLHDSEDGDVGCAYALLRAAISERIAEGGEHLVDEVARLLPSLIRTPEDREYALAVTQSHGRLAQRAGFRIPGRQLVLGAISHGAEADVFEGDHTATNGILNREPGSTLDGPAAVEAGLPAYNHDAWAAEAIAERLGDPFDSRQRQIANAIDAIGTMEALGVDAVLTRG